MSGKKLLAKTNRSLESPPPPTATSSLFWGGKDDLQTEQHVAGEFLASNFLDENKSRQQREFVFGSSISPPEKARIFSYKKMYSNISLLSTWVALAGNRHKTPRDSSSTAKRHLLSYMYFFVMLIQIHLHKHQTKFTTKSDQPLLPSTMIKKSTTRNRSFMKFEFDETSML